MNHKRKIPIKTCLLILILVAYAVTGISLANYLTVVSGDGSIRAARYVIEMNVYDNSVPVTLEMSEMKPGDTAQYDIVVSNYKDSQRTEVALYFRIEITTDTVLPFDLELEENWINGITYGLDDQTKKIVSGIYSMSVASSSDLNFILTIDWPAGRNDEIYQSLTDTLTVRVVWEQIV